MLLKTLREKDVGDVAVGTKEEDAGTGDKIKINLAVELAATLDTSCLAREIINCEGQGLEALLIYDKIQALLNSGDSLGSAGTMPSMDAG